MHMELIYVLYFFNALKKSIWGFGDLSNAKNMQRQEKFIMVNEQIFQASIWV